MERGPVKVLLIDDDPFFLNLLADVFADSGYSVVTATNGIEGVRAYLDNDPEIVISDLIMPRMGGVSTCIEISRLAGGKEPIIILLTSMFHGEPHEHETSEMGAKIHIPKSTKPLNIVVVVEQLLARRRAAGLAC